VSTGASARTPGRVAAGGALAAWLSAALLLSGGATAAAASGPGAVIGGPRLGGNGVIVSYPAAAHQVAPLPRVVTSSFVVADAGTGQVLAARNPHGYFRPASTLKVLTAVTFIPVLDPNATVVASRRATSTVPNVAGLIAGQRYKVSALFTALLTISANDAAIALAEATGSYARGMAMINAEAARLGARDTVAVDPSGLDARQHTSAYDLALIARQALTMPAFLRYDQTRVAQFQLRPGHSETLFNQNTLLTSYPGGIGGKIGWTSASGATYVGLARRQGVTLIVTLMNCPAQTEITSAEHLLNWGFAADGKVQPVGVLVRPAAGPGRPRTAPSPGAPAASPRTHPDAVASQPAASSATIPAIVLTAVILLAGGCGLALGRRRAGGSSPNRRAGGRRGK
jgi:D-alanyl-D-alanine carboxypeptidase (penicillin-binding protein 5/6)